MNKEQIALELTKLYFEEQNRVYTERLIIEIYHYFLNGLESKGE